jgi:hypothetical protein
MMERRMTFNGPLVWSGLACAAVLIVVLVMFVSLVGALFAPSADTDEVDAEFARLMENHSEAMQTFTDRFNGRSIFFKPKQPRKPLPPPPPRPTNPTPTPVIPSEPRAPATYTGPDIVAFVGDTVWFKDGKTINLGQTEDGIEVLSITAPWSAKIAYAGGEYDVTLFKNTGLAGSLVDPSDRSSNVPGLVELDADGEPADGQVVPQPTRGDDDDAAAAEEAAEEAARKQAEEEERKKEEEEEEDAREKKDDADKGAADPKPAAPRSGRPPAAGGPAGGRGRPTGGPNGRR